MTAEEAEIKGLKLYDIYEERFYWSNGDFYRSNHLFYLSKTQSAPQVGISGALGGTKEIVYTGAAYVSFPVKYPLTDAGSGRLIEKPGKDFISAKIKEPEPPKKKKSLMSDTVLSTNPKEDHPIVKSVNNNVIVFAIGAAGTGKTYTSVYAAKEFLHKREVKKIILCRPAVDSGEDIGYLPGDMLEKMDPFLSPLYDSLDALVGRSERKKLLTNGTIEIIPIGFMRGRSLTDSFIIVDEAQNATYSQLKMIITRLGVGSKMIINGDQTQIDLKHRGDSGLLKIIKQLSEVKGVGCCYLSSNDNYRHPILKEVLSVFSQETNIEN